MNKVAFVTLGCKTNQYETDALMDLFYKNRYEIVDFDDFANVYVINTCTVTSISDKKSRQMIRRAKKSNPNGIVVVVGCYAQISPDEVSAIEDVDIVVGTDARTSILSYISDYMSGITPKPYVIVEDISKIKVFEEMSVSNITTHTRAFVKIQEGCNQFCTYCIIPYARGRVRSRTLSHVVEEIEQLTKKGYVEFVLTGIHIGSYGLDLDHVALIDLIESIHAIEGVKRIRLGSIEPRLISASFVERLVTLEKVCDHFHLSLQSGSNTVLKRMNRKYTSEEFYESVERLKSIYNAPSLTTDIIVGFPGETEEEFLETMAFVEKVGFSEIHVFQFSKREGTPAADMKDQIDGKIKKSRSEQLIAKASQLNRNYQELFMNKQLEVLFEENKDGQSQGHSTNYLNVMVKDQVKPGTLLKVVVTDISENKLIATIEL
ncbi:MAG: tRNA (N(6)-L-threonylcarbamoyladenosine(37)-C(2))-methylthiotransferase MtaB [Clostridiales bacterium 38-18]|nr:MAG: tRNA (N(6)-L-threonylcarbamoyladenosine(37)-C(2))-methylthiotransferase MtaB [Clostridiales bacterium 38-18]